MFRGRFIHTMDAKGRVSIPALFRAEFARLDERPPILTNLVHSVAIYPHRVFLEIEEQLAGASSMQPEVQALQRFFVSGAAECAIDGAGRILVPSHLRDHAGLDKDIVVLGSGRRAEFWNRSRLEADLARTQENFSAWAQHLRL